MNSFTMSNTNTRCNFQLRNMTLEFKVASKPVYINLTEEVVEDLGQQTFWKGSSNIK